jgi:hypothetical protein
VPVGGNACLGGHVSHAGATVSNVSTSGSSTIAELPQIGLALSTVRESTLAVPTELMSTIVP